jgi:hypothetical protein
MVVRPVSRSKNEDGVGVGLTAPTVRVAEAAAPVPAFAEVTGLVTLFFTPGETPVTVTENVQGVPLATVAPDSEIESPETVKVPPHWELVALGTDKPAGRLSVKATLVAEMPLGFVMVKLNETVEPAITDGELNDLVSSGEPRLKTVTLADAAAPVSAVPVPVSVPVTVLVTLFFTPGETPVTVTENVQGVPLATVAPDSELELPETVNVPPHWELVALGTVKPAGRLSVKATPAAAVLLGSVMVKVNETVEPEATVGEPNDLLSTGGPRTVMVADAGAPVIALSVPESIAVTVLVTLFFTPGETPVTVTENVQGVPLATVAPDKAMLLFEMVSVPPHWTVTLSGTDKPAGRLSVNPTLVAFAVFGFVIVKFNKTVDPTLTNCEPNDLVSTGGLGAGTTVRLAVLLVAPGPLSFADTGPDVLFRVPSTVA